MRGTYLGSMAEYAAKTEVISDDTGFARDYTLIPYPTYPTREEFQIIPSLSRTAGSPLKNGYLE
ncbi:MAG: hypothetical protein IPH16_06965 [Haliscomenobacter sp.]|nr:hypothetical protein [Haliscomenobacter sp.]